MAGGLVWSQAEIADLLSKGVEGFLADNPGRSYHSARLKLGRLRAQGIGMVDEPMVPEVTGQVVGREVSNIDELRAAAEAMFDEMVGSDLDRKANRVFFDSGPIAIFFVGDQHIGNAGTDVRRLFEEQEQILATPGAYVVLTGDTVDNFIVSKLLSQNIYDSLAVRDQWALATAYVQNFGKRCIAKVSGNHDQWATKLMGVDYDRQITPNGILYDADDITLQVVIGDVGRVCLRVRHKWRGNSIYNPSHAIERAARFDCAAPDVFVGAHVHQGATSREFILDGKRKLALMSSSYKVYDGYQRQEGFPANDASTAVALVIEDDGTFWGTSNISAVQRYMQAVYL
jgi:hypothetical protein